MTRLTYVSFQLLAVLPSLGVMLSIVIDVVTMWVSTRDGAGTTYAALNNIPTHVYFNTMHHISPAAIQKWGRHDVVVRRCHGAGAARPWPPTAGKNTNLSQDTAKKGHFRKSCC